MGDGIVIDANIMSQFEREYFHERNGSVGELIIDILEKCRIASSEIIEKEWLNTCGSLDFRTWVEGLHATGRIDFIQLIKLPRGCKKKINNTYGLPRNHRDNELIKVAYSTEMKYILTEDMHLYEPKAKTWASSKKMRIMEGRTGQLNRYLSRELGIIVGMCCHCREDIICLQ